jgi:hypothetical protein
VKRFDFKGLSHADEPDLVAGIPFPERIGDGDAGKQVASGSSTGDHNAPTPGR